MEDPDPRPEHPRPAASWGSWQESFRDVAPYLGLGTQMVITMVLFVAGGYFLDEQFATTPWLLLGGTLLGMVVVLLYLFRVVRQLNQNAEARRAAKASDEPPASTS